MKIKKIYIIELAIILVVAVILALVIIKIAKSEPQNNETTEVTYSSKVANIMLDKDYYFKCGMVLDGKDTIFEVSQKGDNYAAVSTVDSNTSGIVCKDGFKYTYISSQKKIVKDTFNKPEISTIAPVEGANYTTEYQEINGQSYYCEKYEGTTYCFLGDNLKYIKYNPPTDDKKEDSNIILEILDFKQKSNDKLFDLPSDYEVKDNTEPKEKKAS